MLEISVLILVLAGGVEHFHQSICFYPSVIQPFRLFRNCQLDNKVRFIGDRVAAVVAETEAIAAKLFRT